MGNDSLASDASFNLSVLSCPDCCEELAYTAAPTTRGAVGQYGILKCSCFRYPVVDGVPILSKRHVGLHAFTSGETGSQGPEVEEVSRLVAEGHGHEALIRCLAFTPPFAFLDRLPMWRVWHSDAVRKLLRSRIERRVRRMLNDRTRLCAEDWFEFYFGQVTAADRSLLPYYRNRVVMPRTLAALSLLQLLPSSDKPVLDLACGFGPFAHYLTNRRNATAVIGADFNFYCAWGQKHWIAPKGTFVCADANHPRLPFKDDTFASIFCSDAFIYVEDKPRLLAEFSRCAPAKPIVLARVGNSTASPHEGKQLDAKGYMQLLASGSPKIFSEYALLRNYLSRSNPLKSDPINPGDLTWDKWLTFVLNTQQLDDVTVAQADEWPHEVGELAINPMLKRRALGNGRQRLWFEFPTIWFAYQNGEMYVYHQSSLECADDLVRHAQLDRADAEIRNLIARFVLIGLPKRYLKAQIADATPAPASTQQPSSRLRGGDHSVSR